MATKPSISSRNQSPFGWWIYRELEQWTPISTSKTKNRKCLVWENTRIIKARTHEKLILDSLRALIVNASNTNETCPSRAFLPAVDELDVDLGKKLSLSNR
jgi:hypothetical protein